MIEVVGAVYAAVVLLVMGMSVGERMSFANPRYHRCVLVGLLWPFVLVQLFAAWKFDFYLGDWLREKGLRGDSR